MHQNFIRNIIIKKMITAQECRDIQRDMQAYHNRYTTLYRLERLDKLIRERVNSKYNFRSLPLNNTEFSKLTILEKKFLQIKGFKIWEGHGGKCGTFDIIGW